ncbi:DUF4174 domain-containing protein [Rhizobium sp. BK060]|uniref:DUF4174 domain-containing protein n=1 Tax=Rhizobium sp. BK060 TaxID=2587096 RepID=UPI001FF006C7|nr:DUF4174 domain-containing protein [Rhizobium sp. BK060]
MGRKQNRAYAHITHQSDHRGRLRRLTTTSLFFSRALLPIAPNCSAEHCAFACCRPRFFSSFNASADIGADQIRADRSGPSPEEFEAILVDADGQVKFRSMRPVSVQYVIDLIDKVPLRIE